jgi:hypothetical protein
MLYGNQMTGTIPPALGSLTNLVALCAPLALLRVRRCAVPCGALGSLLEHRSSFVRSWLSANKFSGTIPHSLGLCTNLAQLCAPAAPAWQAVHRRSLADDAVLLPALLAAFCTQINWRGRYRPRLGLSPSCANCACARRSAASHNTEECKHAPLGRVDSLTPPAHRNLNTNRLNGTIPHSFGSMTNLVALYAPCHRAHTCTPADAASASAG